jgi:hypothetical protein
MVAAAARADHLSCEEARKARVFTPQHRLNGMPAGGEPERSRGQFAQLGERIEMSLNLVQRGAKRAQELLARRRIERACGHDASENPRGHGFTFGRHPRASPAFAELTIAKIELATTH